MSAPRTPLTDKTPWALVFLLGSLTAMGPLAVEMYLMVKAIKLQARQLE